MIWTRCLAPEFCYLFSISNIYRRKDDELSFIMKPLSFLETICNGLLIGYINRYETIEDLMENYPVLTNGKRMLRLWITSSAYSILAHFSPERCPANFEAVRSFDLIPVGFLQNLQYHLPFSFVQWIITQ
jgi:hypothetical protein